MKNYPYLKNSDLVSQKRPRQQQAYNTVRQLKIQAKTVIIPRSLHYAQRSKEVPSLLLSGEWLRNAGFDIGKQVTIIPEKGLLMIKII